MNTFREAARNKNFLLTAECFLKPETDAASICQQADLLRDCVDGVVLTDNQFGQLHMSTVAAARLFLDNDVDPILQLSCRNRNRIALLADMLGAVSLGVTSLLLVQGNRVPKAIKPRPKAVLDMETAELIATAAAMKTNEQLRSIPDLFIGSSVTSHLPKDDWVPRKLVEKADAGAQFLLTHICMDTELLREYMKYLVAARITRRLSVVVSIAILSSAADAVWARDNRPSATVPDSVVQRLEDADDPRAEGVRHGIG